MDADWVPASEMPPKVKPKRMSLSDVPDGVLAMHLFLGGKVPRRWKKVVAATERRKKKQKQIPPPPVPTDCLPPDVVAEKEIPMDKLDEAWFRPSTAPEAIQPPAAEAAALDSEEIPDVDFRSLPMKFQDWAVRKELHIKAISLLIIAGILAGLWIGAKAAYTAGKDYWATVVVAAVEQSENVAPQRPETRLVDEEALTEAQAKVAAAEASAQEALLKAQKAEDDARAREAELQAKLNKAQAALEEALVKQRKPIVAEEEPEESTSVDDGLSLAQWWEAVVETGDELVKAARATKASANRWKRETVNPWIDEVIEDLKEARKRANAWKRENFQ